MVQIHVFVGIGIRTITDISQAIVQLILNAPTIRKCYVNGQSVRLIYELFDKNSETASGGGFLRGDLAAINLGIPEAMNPKEEIETLKRHLEEQYHYIIPLLTDPVACVQEFLYTHGSEIYKEMEVGNPCAWTMHLNSFDRITGTLIPDRACVPRMAIYHGLVEIVLPKLHRLVQNINAILDLPLDVVEPAVELRVHWKTEVVDFDCETDFERPKLLVKSGEGYHWEFFDYLTINTGAAFDVLEPVDPKVKERTIPYRFTAKELEAFYKKFGLLEDGKFTKKARIGVPGRKLFSYDKKTSSVRFLDYKIVLDHGFQFVDLSPNKNYESTFVTFSRNMHEILHPRLGNTDNYKGVLDLFGAEFAHACLLQKGTGTIQFLTKMADIDASLTTKVSLEEIHKKWDIRDLHISYANEIERFIDSASTGPVLGEILRSNRQAFALRGKSLKFDRETEENRLCRKYPATRPGLMGWTHDKMIDTIFGATPSVLKGSNTAYDNTWKLLMDSVTGPPIENARPMMQLVLQGYDKHVVGDARDVVFDQEFQRLRLGDELFDVQHATVVLSSLADPLINKKLPALKDNGAGLPKLAKGRHLQSKDGRILPIAYFGSAVEGTKVLDGTKKRSTAGRQASDITSWSGAAETGPIKAKFALLVCLLAEMKRANAVQDAIQLYWYCLPNEKAHNVDVGCAETAWVEGLTILHFCTFVLNLTDDVGEQTRILRDWAGNAETRKTFIANLPKDKATRDKLRRYRIAVRRIPVFTGVSHNEFHSNIIDFQSQYLDKALNIVADCVGNGEHLLILLRKAELRWP